MTQTTEVTNDSNQQPPTRPIPGPMGTPAYRALSSSAKALLFELRLASAALPQNSNGAIALSIRQAADRLGVAKHTAAKAFDDLQAKGFLLVTALSHPKAKGMAAGHSYELTEQPLRYAREGKNLYRHWNPDQEFTIVKSLLLNSEEVKDHKRTLKGKTA